MHPKNIQGQEGVLRIVTVPELMPDGGWDCGNQIEHNTEINGVLYTKVCHYSGGMIISLSNYPWNEGNHHNHPDKDKRYTGANFGYGRFEFRAKIPQMGHGAWPALWMWVDRK